MVMVDNAMYPYNWVPSADLDPKHLLPILGLGKKKEDLGRAAARRVRRADFRAFPRSTHF